MKICFWGNISDSINGHTPGGGELQIALLAKALVLAGNEVIIIDPGGKKDFVSKDGIKVITIKGWDNGIQILRTLTHRLPQFYKLLKDQKADVYYCRIRDFRHIFAFWAARKNKAKFILALASDLDVLSFWMRCKHNYFSQKRDSWLFVSGMLIEIFQPFLLRNSDIVFAQHEGQKAILDKKSIVSLVNPNLIDLTVISSLNSLKRDGFVWVGSLKKRKGVIELYELAIKSPQHNITVIGQASDASGYKYYEKLKNCPNVTLLGRLSHDATIREIANSKAIISTSKMEGFPNIFIEAWACGIPVISLFVNPGNVLEKNHLGYFANGSMANLLQELSNYNTVESIDIKAKKYVENTHILSKNKISEINAVFERLIMNHSNKRS